MISSRTGGFASSSSLEIMGVLKDSSIELSAVLL